MLAQISQNATEISVTRQEIDHQFGLARGKARFLGKTIGELQHLILPRQVDAGKEADQISHLRQGL